MVVVLYSCNNSVGQEIKKLEPSEFQSAIRKAEQPQVIDVRTTGEFESGHLDGAKNMNVNSADFEEELLKLEKDKPLFLYCAAGSRSSRAAKVATKKGFKEVYDLSGGMAAWNDQKLPVKK